MGRDGQRLARDVHQEGCFALPVWANEAVALSLGNLQQREAARYVSEGTMQGI